MDIDIEEILRIDAEREGVINRTFNPVTGEGSVGERFRFELEDGVLLLPSQIGTRCAVLYLPLEMQANSLVRNLMEDGSVKKYCIKNGVKVEEVVRNFDRLRSLYDFPYWAACYAYIKKKGGGDDVLFQLNLPQRKMVDAFERSRCAGKPIRIIVLKARQWGGSTCAQIYMSWLQLVHARGLNSLIIAHQSAATEEIKDMFDRLINHYPLERMLDMKPESGEDWKKMKKMSGVGRSGAAVRLEPRNCKIKVGTAERPDSCRGGDYNLVHLSEVGVWKKTLGKSPDDMVRSACSGILYENLTMIVYESTANGTGNFFHREYEAARRGESQFEPLFVSWYEIQAYSLPPDDKKAFATDLLRFRNQEDVDSDRREPGRYLWSLWEKGATLSAINWYVHERAKYNDHGMMASEYPSDDIEAFVHSGARVFDRYKVEALRGGCRRERFRGEIIGESDCGMGAIRRPRFVEDDSGSMKIWSKPVNLKGRLVTDRYVVVVDIGGRAQKSDWSVVCVFDRLYMASGGVPEVVAQWRGHCDIDLLAWKAVTIAAYYNNALLVVESNTLETRDRERYVEGDQSNFILNQIREVYDNLYARRQIEEAVKLGVPTRYGFHTNTSTKPMIISFLVRMIREGLYVEREEMCLDEYLCYERRQNGSYGAISGKHDDMLMTRAIGLHICYNEMERPELRNVCIEKRSGARLPVSEASISI